MNDTLLIRTVRRCVAVVEVPRLSVDGVRVGDRDGSAGQEGLAFEQDGVGVPPLAEQDGPLPVGPGERVHAPPRPDDELAVYRGAQERAVRVPPQRALLPGHGELVRVPAARADRALRHHRRAIRPRRLTLEHAVPA
jgi:hypothetical protein